MLELWLIRHGETEWNLQRRMQGHADIPLAPTGEAQAQKLAQRLRTRSFDSVWSSDLSRARRTAEIAFPGREVTIDARLREISAGVFEGHRFAELDTDPPPGFAEWRTDPFTNRPPGGETGIEMRERLMSWMRDLPPAGSAAAVVHAGVVRMLLFDVLGDPAQGAWPFEFAPTAITRLVLPSDGGMRRIRTVNDAAHLEETSAGK